MITTAPNRQQKQIGMFIKGTVSTPYIIASTETNKVRECICGEVYNVGRRLQAIRILVLTRFLVLAIFSLN